VGRGGGRWILFLEGVLRLFRRCAIGWVRGQERIHVFWIVRGVLLRAVGWDLLGCVRIVWMYVGDLCFVIVFFWLWLNHFDAR